MVAVKTVSTSNTYIHTYILIDADLKPIRLSQPPRHIFQFSKANKENILAELSSLRDSFFTTNLQYLSDRFLDSYNRVHNNIKEIVNKHVPRKTVKSKKYLPWFNRHLKKLHRKKFILHKKAKSQPQNLQAWTRYTDQQKLFKNSLKIAEQNYISRHLTDSVNTSPKTFFSFFKARRQDTTNIAALKKDNILVTTSVEKADLLNKQFQSAFTKEDANLPDLPDSPYQNISPLTFTTLGIQKLLSDLNCSKATGPDGISPWILKHGAEIIAPIYQVLFTWSLSSSVLPFDWLTANVNPLFKSGDRTLASNYRPISLTSIPCKIMEHIVAKHIMNHLDKYNILSDSQHGFRPKRSCETH